MQFTKILFNGFEWDLGNSEKAQKHGVSLQEIEKVFLQKVLYFEDIRNSGHEKRFILVGFHDRKAICLRCLYIP